MQSAAVGQFSDWNMMSHASEAWSTEGDEGATGLTNGYAAREHAT
jgi:hypothetical protein